MCLNPTLIKNPNYKSKTAKSFKKDTVSQYLKVPCGHCSECLGTRYYGMIQRCELEEVYSHPFKILLTYMNSMIPRYVCSDGKEITYADFKDVINMFKRLRKSNAIGRPFRYFCVSERGDEGRPHFHLMLYVQKYPDDNYLDILNLESLIHSTVLSNWVRNVAPPVWSPKKNKLIPNSRNPQFKPLCHYVEYIKSGKRFGTYGCQYVSPSLTDGSTLGATAYVSKYFLKKDKFSERLQRGLKLNLPFYEYNQVWNKVRCRYITSLNFGFGLFDYQAKKMSKSERLDTLSHLETFKFVKQSLQRSINTLQDSPKYYALGDGRTMPLSRYFYHIDNLYTVPIYNHFKDLSNKYGDFVSIDERDTTALLFDKEVKDKRLNRMFNYNDSTDFID